MKKSSSKSQGIQSRNLVRPGIRTGASARVGRPAGASQVGSSRGDHSTGHGHRLTKDVEPLMGKLKPIGSPGTVELGNECALQSAGSKANPGSGRTVYSQSGSQSSYSGQAMPPTVKTQAKY